MDKKKILCILLLLIGIIHCIEDVKKFDCYPEGNANETLCAERGCSWEKRMNNPKNIPGCFYPQDHNFTFTIENKTSTKLGEKLFMTLNTAERTKYPDQNLFTTPVVSFEYHTETRLRMKIFDDKVKRYEVPLVKEFGTVISKPTKTIYRYVYNKDPFSVAIYASRGIKSVKIWDTSVGALILSNQYLQISSQVPSTYLYGIGENSRASFKRDFSKWHSIGLYSRDQAPYPFHNVNLYGVHPFYMIMEPDGNAHGVLLLNSNAMDITLQPTPALTYRTVGGVLDFYFFFGPTPEEVVQQYTELVGHPVMPSYWSLGFQLCRYGYNSLDEVKRTVARMSKYDIPQDVQYGDIDYMERQLDFTYDNQTYAGLPEYVKKIKRDGIKYITILDPAISSEEASGTYEPYDLGEKLDIWIKDETGKSPLIGKVWPDKPNVIVNTSWPWDEQTKYFRANATFPDWFHSKIESWWNVLIKKFHKKIEFDGLWIDMNEVANFVKGSVNGCSNNNLEKPPYSPKIINDLSDKTLCSSAQHEDGEIEYNYHSLYGWKQSKVTRNALTETTGKRGIVISRSTFPSSGKYAGHWLGDNKSDWPQMHESIIGMMDFSLFGMSYTGADVCGFNEDTTYDLCRRWMQLGAFYPMSRNHNGLGFKAQDPAVFDKDFASMSRNILHVRYTLLPYLYTLMFEAHSKGSTVVRPMFHVFPKDKNTWIIDKQFFWGNHLLITPVLEKDATKVLAYLPNTQDRWFDYFTGSEVPRDYIGKKKEWNIPLTSIGLHIKGGSIIPTQDPANNTEHSRKNPMGLMVAFDQNYNANGKLFWDDGDSIDSIANGTYLMLQFNASKNGMNIIIESNGYPDAGKLFFNKFYFFGLQTKTFDNIVINGVVINDVSYQINGMTTINNLKMPITKFHNITWSIKEADNGEHMDRFSVILIALTSLIAIIYIYN